MFARHTPTRMRGSGVVQSLKSLASKLHPQLPLSPKESQRLLTALTSSFRAKLDEAHPPRARDEDTRPKVDRGSAVNSGNHALHTSSVVVADKHLASILTNPLLTKSYGTKKPALNLESAQRELEQNSDRDPISVLEEYHEKGAATIPIANLCLMTFRESLTNLSSEDRQVQTAKTEAGRRTLQWLWNSELYDTDAFVDNRALMGALVSMLTEEGKEHFLWSWLRMDMKLGTQAKGSNMRLSRGHSYRWKDFMLRIMVMRRMDDFHPKSLNDVLDTYFKAVDLRHDVAQTSTTNYVPLGSAINAINNRIFLLRSKRKQWDAKRYDRYMGTMAFAEHSPMPHWTSHYEALLRLTHPRDPSPLPMFESLKGSFFATPSSLEAMVYASYGKSHHGNPNEQKIRRLKYYKLIETAQQLNAGGYKEELEWLMAQIRSLCPEQERFLERDLRNGPKPPTLRSPPAAHTVHLPIPAFTGVGTT